MASGRRAWEQRGAGSHTSCTSGVAGNTDSALAWRDDRLFVAAAATPRRAATRRLDAVLASSALLPPRYCCPCRYSLLASRPLPPPLPPLPRPITAILCAAVTNTLLLMLLFFIIYVLYRYYYHPLQLPSITLIVSFLLPPPSLPPLYPCYCHSQANC